MVCLGMVFLTGSNLLAQNVSTGTDNAGNSIPVGAVDPNWVITAGPVMPTAYRVVSHPSWEPTPVLGTNAGWINGTGTLYNNPPGIYTFERSFTISNSISSFTTNFDVAVDDVLLTLELIDPTGAAIPLAPPPSSPFLQPVPNYTQVAPMMGTWKIRARVFFADPLGGWLLSGYIRTTCGDEPCNCEDLQPIFDYTINLCEGTFYAGGDIPDCLHDIKYDWYVNGSYVGSGTPFTYTFPGNGSYTVCLKVSGVTADGTKCEKEFCKSISITDCDCDCSQLQPNFDFIVDQCKGIFYAGGNIPDCLSDVKYDWYVNGWYVGSGTPFSYVFPSNGTYVVCLVISGTMPDGSICSKEFCREIKVKNCGCNCDQLQPTFDYVIDLCKGIFTAGGNIPTCLQNVKYDWYVNGGYVGSGTPFSYTFSGNGTYVVCLRVSGIMPDGSKCEKEFCREVTITDCGCHCEQLQPNFDFIIDQCKGIFYAGGNIPACLTNIKYDWFVNGGFVGSGTPFSYIFPGNGTYLVCLKISGTMPDGSICSKEFCKEVTITDCGCNCEELQPNFDYFIQLCKGTFYAGGYIPDCLTNIKYDWFVNGGYVGSGTPFTYTFPGNGVYVVCLKISGMMPDGSICSKEVCREVRITDCGCNCEQLQPDFDYSIQLCHGTFYGGGNIPACLQNVKYNWYINGSFVGTGTPFNYVFSGNGTYVVCLVISGIMPDGSKCEREICKEVTVTDCGCNCEMLQPMFDYTINGCIGKFFAGGNIPACLTNVTYNWYVNGMYAGTGTPFTFTFPGNGTYSICLIVKGVMPNGEICEREYCRNVTVTNCGPCTCEQLVPMLNFTMLNGCCAQFSVIGGIPPCLQNVTFRWFVNNVFVGAGNPFNYCFPGNGTYNVCVVVTGILPTGQKCQRQVCRPITIQGCIGVPTDPAGMIINNEESLMEQSMLLYPNPASDELNISLNLEKAGDVTFVLKSMEGKELLTEKATAEAGEQEFILKIPASIVNGMVFIEIHAGNERIVRKIEISRQ